MVQFLNSGNQKSITEREINYPEAHYPETFGTHDPAHLIMLICTQRNDSIAEYIDKS